MQSNKTESLQDLAKNAKKRMKQGYWSDIIESRKKDMDIASKNGVDKSEVISYYKDRVLRDFYVKTERVEREERLYKKVVEIMDSEEIVYNPLARLVEHEYYDNLDEDGKVAYIFNLASKYSKLRKRYFEEKKTSVK
ncbi:MAG: hypothetical protein HFK07_06545 [Clostridia bacterium]|jgi:hypothetical protein|nr:hypothetical protein [Clostridia bacterium]MCX4366784.1 hypothetical protein [Clostridia bacterium]